MIRTTLLATAMMFSIVAFAQDSPSTPKQTAPVNNGHEGATSAADKVTAYDKWAEPQKMSVSKSMGRDMSKMSSSERADAWAKMTADEKGAAYDYYMSHETKSKKTN